MAIDFAQRIAAANNAAATKNSNVGSNAKPQAQIWLNIGYTMGEGENRKFVSLPVGIPLDTQEPIKIKGQSQDYNDFSESRNELLEMLIKAAQELPPGGEDYVNLEIQIRRVAAPVEASKGEANPYSLSRVAGTGFSLLAGGKAD